MVLVLNGHGDFTGLSVGCLPNGVITGSDIAANTITSNLISPNTTFRSDTPYFHVYRNAVRNVATNTYTNLSADTVVYDALSNYNSSTGTWTPTVSGFYMINYWGGTAASNAFFVSLYKNGTFYQRSVRAGASSYSSMGLIIDYAAPGDYYQVFLFHSQGSTVAMAEGRDYNGFQALLIKGA